MDLNELAALFHLHEKAAQHGTSLSHIKDWAYKQLLAENETLKHAGAEPGVEEELPPDEPPHDPNE
jgi:hypothetical protein